MIANIDSNTWSNLIFVLARHDLSIGSRNIDTGVEACFVVSVSDDPTEANVSSH